MRHLFPERLVYENLSPNLVVQFSTKRIPGATVAWLNRRWCLEQGLNVGVPKVRDNLENFLLETYGRLAVESSPDQPEPSTVDLYADRYGGTGGTRAGGSGRCGTRNGLNAKGIGRTPLVGSDSDWYHSHGAFFLEEAIREAIFSELAIAEFPSGGVPVIAIINTGVKFAIDGQLATRAIVVRPNFIRLAHLQRTIFFGDAGTEDSEQFRDALRVRDVATGLYGTGLKRWPNVNAPSLFDSLRTIAHQIGWCRAHRIWLGSFTSSNAELFGAAFDFGSTRSLPDWTNWRGHRKVPRVGSDLDGLKAATLSVISQVDPVIGTSTDSSTVLRAIDTAYLAGFRSAVEGALDIEQSVLAGKAADLLLALFRKQSALKRDLDEISDQREVACLASEPPALALADLIAGSEIRMHELVNARLVRFLSPRLELHRESLIAANNNLLTFCDTSGADLRTQIDRHITGVVARNRRAWPKKPPWIHIVDTAYDGAVFTSEAIDIRSNKRGKWVEGPANTFGMDACNKGRSHPLSSASMRINIWID